MIDLKHGSSTKLLWLDLEMTGLNVETDRIIEVAAIVTDFKFKELAFYHSAIYQNRKILANMNDWSKEHHTASGLIEKVKTAPKEPAVIENLQSLIKTNFREPVILAGNSIHYDRSFIKKWWPQIDSLLHYRMLDVSSFKVLMQNKYGVIYKKREVHLALDDIKESIAELKYYLDYFEKNES